MRQQVVHAQRVKRDLADDDELVVVRVVGKGCQRDRLVRQKLRESGGHPPRGLAQPGVSDVAAERHEEVANRPLGCVAIDRRRVIALDQIARMERGDRRRTRALRAQRSRRGAS
jgi:hypothetical protein